MDQLTTQPPSADQGAKAKPSGYISGAYDDDPWLALAQDAFSFSTNYFDSNYRKRVEDSLKAFANQHPNDSKYNSSLFDKRSKVFRPKTRSVIRKNEAAAAAAFFSNMDVLDVVATNEGDQKQVASAQCMKQLLQYRLTKSIPWFKVCIGGLQDAQKTGVCIAWYRWDYEEIGTEEPGIPGEELQPKVKVDQPVIDLVPIENFRFDPATPWDDVVGKSPYLIHLIPMFAGDVRSMMTKTDPKTGALKWVKLSERHLTAAAQVGSSSTRIIRERSGQDPTDGARGRISDYEVVWVQRHIHRKDGEDWLFWTLADVALLSKPVKISKALLHGQRDYVMGSAIIETHTTMPSSVAELGKGLQDETNEVANQRLDNVKMVLNKKWFVKRGKNVDISGLMRNVPGAAIMMDDPESDIKEVSFPDVTASAYQEQDRINADFDDLLGNFSAGSVMTNRSLNETAAGMAMLTTPATVLTQYLLWTYVKTFVEPLLQGMVKLEQAYETDMNILAISGEKAQLLQKFGIDRVTDDLLQHDVTCTVNVGMGATDPQSKLQRFIAGVSSYANIVKMMVPGLNTNEIGKEIFAHSGYQDGKRFMTNDDPQKLQMQQQILQMQMAMRKQEIEKNNKHEANITKLMTVRATNESRERIAQMQHQKSGRDIEHGQVIEAHKARMEHERKSHEIALNHDLKMKQFAAELIHKIEQANAQHKMALVESERRHAMVTEGSKEKPEAKNAEPVVVKLEAPKPRGKIIKITKDKDGNMIGQVTYEPERKEA